MSHISKILRRFVLNLFLKRNCFYWQIYIYPITPHKGAPHIKAPGTYIRIKAPGAYIRIKTKSNEINHVYLQNNLLHLHENERIWAKLEKMVV